MIRLSYGLNHMHKHTSIRSINEQMKNEKKTRSSGAYEVWSNFKCVFVSTVNAYEVD